MNDRLWLVLGVTITLFLGLEATCGSELSSTSLLDSPNGIITRLWVNSIYSYSIIQDDSFKVSFRGTNAGNASWVASSGEATLSITSDGYVIDAPAGGSTPSTSSPKPKQTISSSTTLSSFSVLSFVGLVVLNRPTPSAAAILAALICLSSVNVIYTAGDPPCDGVQVSISIPSGQVNFVCDVKTGTCECGPDYSGPNCNYYKSTCMPTEEQMAKRFNFPSAYAPEDIPLPAPGESFCDTNFGTEVWRLTNREPLPQELVDWVGTDTARLNDQRVHIFGFLGFSPGNRYFCAVDGGFGAILYEVNMDQYNIPHINSTTRVFAIPIYNEEGALALLDANTAVWMTDTTLVYIFGYKIYAFDVRTAFNKGSSFLTATTIGDLTPFLENNYYPDPFGATRCSFSKRHADGSLIAMCALGYAIGTLSQPDVNHVDSHPNATCIAAQWGPNFGGAPGYFVIKIKSAAPEDPATNIELMSRFINGVDSDEWYCFQSVQQWSSALNGYRTWTLYNGLNNGYKGGLDRSGQWISHTGVINKPDTNSVTVGFQPGLHFKYRPLPEGRGIGVDESRVYNFMGHGSLGWGNVFQQALDFALCVNACISYWDFQNMTDDDPGLVRANAAIGENFDNGPWLYLHGLYGTQYHATETNREEALFQSGCDASLYDCNSVPRGSEVMRVKPDGNGGGTIERLVSTRDASYTQYTLISSECDDTGPCWAAFQSTWGVPRSGYTNSDVFIFRFR